MPNEVMESGHNWIVASMARSVILVIFLSVFSPKVEKFAHSGNSVGNWHLLREHLLTVAVNAESIAAGTGFEHDARIAGLLHDLGKYADRFQKRLRGEDAGLDHWSQGAWIALTKFKAVAAALAIQGHHTGLQRGDHESLRKIDPTSLVKFHPQNLQLSDPDPSALVASAIRDGIDFDELIDFTPLNIDIPRVSFMLDVRMLFSCLVDSDFLDTEAHFNGDARGKSRRASGPSLNAESALYALNRYMMDRVRAAAGGNLGVDSVRETLWSTAGRAGKKDKGVFTLTAPTGSGKTLAMLRFALAHAVKHNLKRIVLAVPYLTIIEQTAQVYRNVFAGFGANYILEHHSLAGLGVESEVTDSEIGEKRQRRLLSENWDAPIVITTNVQLLESLFSNRPSSCRKLHNLIDSVILFDEAQNLPQQFAVPTLSALSHLSITYRSSIVFATATQPAFDLLDNEVKKHAVSGWNPVEIVTDHPEMFKTLNRVRVTWPKNGERHSWENIAAELHKSDQVLIIVNLKRHAQELLHAVGGMDHVFHLSTNLCALHRRAVLDRVRERLMAERPCKLISTQCVEAGVDIDFPKVFRAFAPLDSIAQAAGRCNREGKMNLRDQLGKMIVFEPKEVGDWRSQYPAFDYYQATEITRNLLSKYGGLDINDPDVFKEYYRNLYDITKPAARNQELFDAFSARDFIEVARRYRLINQDAIQVLVPWSGDPGGFAELRREAERDGISPAWMRRAHGFSVSIYKPRNGTPAWAIPCQLPRRGRNAGGFSDEWFILEGDYYDDLLGLVPPKTEQVFIA